ncbi:response regulator [Virgibacillus halodenitrificans]|uniref:response regulator n=1 Tax=Virgibacillus halodenitrificans TaxID=1482 RepID=UPI001EEE6A47|nr:response regulator [Virgibacillus halodenitrificans]MCG1028114.1 response regulator [Virgibacillus halodenitrificans]
MRILIAEDELLERKAMKKFIEQNFGDMKIVGEAVNGRMAIELAAAEKPDVIFMDIKMPGINGLEAIREIHKTHPQTKFILVSAYDSFDYAKEAMQYGIKDYILKPGKKEEIVKAIMRIKKELEAEKEQQQQSRAMLQERFLLQAMKQTGSEELHDMKQRLFPEMKSGSFLVVTFTERENGKRLMEVLASICPYTSICRLSGERATVCILADVVMEKAELLTLAKKISNQLESAAYIGIGFPVKRLAQLYLSYEQAYTASLQLAADKKRNVGFPSEKAQDATRDNKLETLLGLVEKGNGEEAVQLFQQYHVQLSESMLEKLYLTIKRLFMERDMELGTRPFSMLKTSADWNDFLLLSCMHMQQLHNSKQYMEQVKQYIAEHYQEPLTLEKVAATVHLSTNYFSNLFKQELGETFTEYLAKIRMHQAKKLIESNQYTLKEISYMVGYNNPNYFSRVFRKHFNESPKQFQRSIFK